MKIEKDSLIYRATLVISDDPPKNGFSFTRRLLLFAAVYGSGAAYVMFLLLLLHGEIWNYLLGLGLDADVHSDTGVTLNLAYVGLGLLTAAIVIPFLIGLVMVLKGVCGSIELVDGGGEPEDKAAI